MNPADYEVAFKIISVAGNAKSSCLMAIRESREGTFDEAAKLLAEADGDLHQAHDFQTKMLQDEARGNAIPLNIILVHAQDHLTGAILVRDLADEFIEINKRLANADQA